MASEVGSDDEIPGEGDQDDVARELRAREPVFHRAPAGTTREAFEAMTVPDYWEVGASGTIYDRSTVLDTLAARYRDPEYDPMAGLEVREFAVRRAGGDAWLATYRLRQGDRWSRRVSVWRREAGRWLIVYHQGTITG